ncbi:MAG: hypothetical protein U9O65_05530 [Thermotogota bacterium]|nr:hypothetical protein [Thermotogota bacterium]
MHSWKEIQEYREKEIEEAVILIGDIWKDKKGIDYFRGMMDMFERIILLPKKMCQENELEYIEDMVNQDFKRVEINLLRRVTKD